MPPAVADGVAMFQPTPMMSPYWDRASLATVLPSPVTSHVRPMRGEKSFHWYGRFSPLTICSKPLTAPTSLSGSSGSRTDVTEGSKTLSQAVSKPGTRTASRV